MANTISAYGKMVTQHPATGKEIRYCNDGPLLENWWRMYRIRLVNGEEVVYRSAKELTTAVASGVVSPTAEVFHNSGSRWLPIHLHPDYKAATSGQQPVIGFPATLAKAARGKTPVAPVAALVAPEPPRPVEPQVPAAAAAPLPLAAGFDSRARKLRTMLALAMSLAGIISLGGAGLMAAPFLKRGVAGLSGMMQRTEGMDPAPLEALFPRVDSGFGPFPAPSAPFPMGAAARLDSLLAAAPGATTTTQLRASRPRSISYPEAYTDARDEMDTGLDYINFRRVFAGYRFASPDSIRATRRMVSAARNILRVYRGREVMLEQSYRPDDPGGHGSFREPFEAAEASRALLSDVDSLFGLLATQQGRFSWTESGLRFHEPRTARAYMRLRSDILQSLAAWRDSTLGPNQATYPRLAAGLGQLGPPPAR